MPTDRKPHARTSRGATARDGLDGYPCKGRNGSWLAVSLRMRNGSRRPEPVGAGRAESAADRSAAEGAATRRVIQPIPEAWAAAPEATAEGGRGTGARRRERARAAARSAGAPLLSCHCAGGDHLERMAPTPSRTAGAVRFPVVRTSHLD